MQKQIKIHFRIKKHCVIDHSTEWINWCVSTWFEKFKSFWWFACYSNWLLMVHKFQICFIVKLFMLLYMHSILVSMFIMFPIIKIEKLHGSRTKTSLKHQIIVNVKNVTFPLVSWVRCGTWLYRFLIFATLLTTCISCVFPHCYRFQKLMKLCQYTKDTWKTFYRQYHRLTITGTYGNCRQNLTFSWFSLKFFWKFWI